MRRRTPLLIVTLVLAVAACGIGQDGEGNSLSAAGQRYQKAISDAFVHPKDDDIKLPQDQADCVADRWVNTLDPERLEKAGIEPSDLDRSSDDELKVLDLDDDEAGALYDAFGQCDVDIDRQFAERIGRTAGRGATDEQLSCIGKELRAKKVVRKMFVAEFRKDGSSASSSMQAQIIRALRRCDLAPTGSGN